MKILLTQSIEDGRTFRQTMTQDHGIEFSLVREMDTPFGSNTTVTVHTYERSTDSARRWVIEAEKFAHPDIQWTETFVLDTAPTDREVDRIVQGKPVA